MADRPRVFDFDVGTEMSDALRTIRAALDDEGLALGPRAGSGDQVTSVIVDGHERYRVPLTRVWSKDRAAAYYAAVSQKEALE